MKQTLFILLFLTFGFGILYWLLKPPAKVSVKLDDDYDGVLNEKDHEVTTNWITDSIRYPLRDFVNSNGLVDEKKTKTLCNCWDFQDVKERKVLKCQNNLYWFVVNGKLYEYRMEGAGTKRFYSSAYQAIPTNADSTIEVEHRRLFPQHYRTYRSKTEAKNLEQQVVIQFQGRSYQVNKVLTAKKGMRFNGSNYRYFGSKWQYQNNPPNGGWLHARDKDIKHLLKSLVNYGKVKIIDKKTPELKEKPEVIPPKKIENVHSANDQYWIYLNKLTDEELNTKSAEIFTNMITKSPMSPQGKIARINVRKRIHAF